MVEKSSRWKKLFNNILVDEEQQKRNRGYGNLIQNYEQEKSLESNASYWCFFKFMAIERVREREREKKRKKKSFKNKFNFWCYDTSSWNFDLLLHRSLEPLRTQFVSFNWNISLHAIGIVTVYTHKHELKKIPGHLHCANPTERAPRCTSNNYNFVFAVCCCWITASNGKSVWFGYLKLQSLRGASFREAGFKTKWKICNHFFHPWDFFILIHFSCPFPTISNEKWPSIWNSKWCTKCVKSFVQLWTWCSWFPLN